MGTTNPPGVSRVVVIVQENHTTDNYFRGLAPWGVNVATDWPTQANPPGKDQPHDRRAYGAWLRGAGKAARTQFDTHAVLPYYAWLALNGAFLENHCSGFGTNSTPNHLLLLGGQTPTLRNPPRNQPAPVWDMPSLPGHAQDHGVSWRCYTASNDYPAGFYTQLNGSPNLVPSSRFVDDAQAGSLPQLCYLWHDSPEDEHPPADVTVGMGAVQQAVDAVVQGGGWEETVFLLTWDDWGGWDDHVATPNVEQTADGVQVAYGPRVPLLMFGGAVPPVIDSRWCSHVSIPRTALQLLGLPALGVPRVDDDPGLADLVATTAGTAPPPALGTPVPLPAPPTPPRTPSPVPPSPGTRRPTPDVVLRGGGTMPAPDDVTLHA